MFLGVLDTSVKRFAFHLAIAVRSANKGHMKENLTTTKQKQALLSQAPQNLYRLWDEYEHRL